MSMSRIYIREGDPVGSSFYSNGTLDVAKLKEYPVLLVTETGGNGPQFARVAYITNITLGHEVSIQYAIDNSIQPISNAELEGHSVELRLGRFGLSHTCWSVCDVDLFKLLLQNQQKRSISPKVFSLEAAYSQDENLVSIMMPFGAEFNPVHAALQQSISAVGLESVRADNIWEHHTIIQDIVNIIARAKVVVCDCSGKNPNVFYEAGVAHAIGKEVILITQSEHDIPFDLRHIRYIRYLPNTEGLADLSTSLQSRLRSIRGW
ncbi:hypothetical protein [Salinicola salarius]|uniref:hypothetical protein n=1 Tax=Salinicola salarius TaxID=430457 RepID=UPI001ABF0437|nr:hypothetical protein [Salinicola salarius]